MFVACAAEPDDGKWKKDFAAFRNRVEQGGDFAGTPGETDRVEWQAKFQSVKKITAPNGSDRYEILFGLESIATPKEKLHLEFTCEKMEFEKWRAVSPDSEVRFTAEWSHFFLAFPGQPLSTSFLNAKLLEVVTRKSGEQKQKQ